MSILSFPLKNNNEVSSDCTSWREKRDEPTTWGLKERAKKKRSRIWGICGQISSLTDVFSKRKLVPDVLQKYALTFCKQDTSLRRKPSAINDMVSSYREFILLVVYSLLFS